MFFWVRGAPARVKIEPKTCSEKSSENHVFLLRFFVVWGPKIYPKWVRFGRKINQKNIGKINAKIYAKVIAKVLQKWCGSQRVGKNRGVANTQTCKHMFSSSTYITYRHTYIHTCHTCINTHTYITYITYRHTGIHAVHAYIHTHTYIT